MLEVLGPFYQTAAHTTADTKLSRRVLAFMLETIVGFCEDWQEYFTFTTLHNVCCRNEDT